MPFIASKAKPEFFCMERIAIVLLSEIQWQGYFDFFQQITRRYMPREWTGNWQAFRDRRLATLEVLIGNEYLILDDQQPVAWIRFQVKGPQLWMDWGTGNETPDPTVVNILLELISQYREQLGHEAVFLESYIPQTQILLADTKAQLLNRRYRYEFHRKNTDLLQLERVAATFAQQQDFHFLLYRDRPDEMLDEYVQLYDLIVQDIPRSDVGGEPYRSWKTDALRKLNESNRKTGNVTYTGVIRSGTGKMVALTDINLHLSHTGRLYQGMTGVHPGFRGLGLAKWLKCELLVTVYREFPKFDVIDTDCNVLNIPMQQLNESLGFVCTGEGREYRIEFPNKQVST